MKPMQAVAASSLEKPDGSLGYGLLHCSENMPEAIRQEALALGEQPDASGEAAHSLRNVEANGESWLLLNRSVPAGEGRIAHTLAFRDDGLAQTHLGELLEEMKADFSKQAQERSGSAKGQVEEIVAEFRREVTALQNRVDEYVNAKWWHFDGEEEIKRRRRDIDKLERTAKTAAEDLTKGYRSKAASILRVLKDGKISGEDGAQADPDCFPELLAKFEKLAGDYREFSRIIAICDRTNVAEASVGGLNAANASLGEQLSVAKRELDVSRLSDKIMSSKMRTDRKEGARAKAGKSSMMSPQTMALIVLSLAVAVLLAMHFLKGPGEMENTGDSTDATAAAELQKQEWEVERNALNEQIRKAQSDTKALEEKIKSLETGN
jgi:hypothetical protein